MLHSTLGPRRLHLSRSRANPTAMRAYRSTFAANWRTETLARGRFLLLRPRSKGAPLPLLLMRPSSLPPCGWRIAICMHAGRGLCSSTQQPEITLARLSLARVRAIVHGIECGLIIRPSSSSAERWQRSRQSPSVATIALAVLTMLMRTWSNGVLQRHLQINELEANVAVEGCVAIINPLTRPFLQSLRVEPTYCNHGTALFWHILFSHLSFSWACYGLVALPNSFQCCLRPRRQMRHALRSCRLLRRRRRLFLRLYRLRLSRCQQPLALHGSHRCAHRRPSSHILGLHSCRQTCHLHYGRRLHPLHLLRHLHHHGARRRRIHLATQSAVVSTPNSRLRRSAKSSSVPASSCMFLTGSAIHSDRGCRAQKVIALFTATDLPRRSCIPVGKTSIKAAKVAGRKEGASDLC